MSGLVVVLGVLGIIFNAINNILSVRFFLVFSPIFVMYIYWYSASSVQLLLRCNLDLSCCLNISDSWNRFWDEAFSTYCNSTSIQSFHTSLLLLQHIQQWSYCMGCSYDPLCFSYSLHWASFRNWKLRIRWWTQSRNRMNSFLLFFICRFNHFD